MTALSDYLESALLEEIFNNVAFAAPDTFIALFTTATTDAGGGTEVSGVNYARIEVNPETPGTPPSWNTAVVDGIGFLVDNREAIDFAVAGAGGWGTITHVAIFDAVTAGNSLMHGALTSSVVINDGSQFSFPVGDLNARLE